MNPSGLTDLPEQAAHNCEPCRCGSLARVASGVCVSCLLRTGLEPAETALEDFDALLASVNVPDRDWQLGNYRILDEIGRGGMGVIYRARHVPSQRIVALKRVLNYHSDSQETLARFQREARAAASLDHPNILPIYDVGTTTDGLPFFSMKFAAGGSLLSMREHLRKAPRNAVQLVAQVARAVDYAHSQGILHRDLKPGNILLDSRGEPMVSDFGLAKWLDGASELTRTLTVFGTPGYIAPEQSENAATELSPATDIYSLGAILFELLSGRPPFLGEHAVAVLRQAAENEAPKLRSIMPKASRDLETICARCLERDPNLRYPSATALAEDIEHWLDGRPIIARPISPLARLYRWSRRNRILAGSVAICLFFAGVVATRQVQSWKLEGRIRAGELARNSIAVLPFLNLDSATEESKWTVKFSDALQTAMSDIGNARVVPIDAGIDWKKASHEFRTRTVLFGTRRKTDRGFAASLHLLSPDGDLLFSRIVDLGEPSDLKPLTRDLAPSLFAVLRANDWSTLVASKRDPGLENESARELITAGRELQFHYTVRDLDRAISCYQKAAKIEPRSALAHAYLASAAATRTHYLLDPSLLAYAKEQVREAARLAPDSPEVLRVLAGVKYQQGHFRNALEDGLHAFEIGPPDGQTGAMIGMVYAELGRPDQSLRWFQLATRIGARAGEYESHIADCWAALNDFEKARTAYERANDLHPDRSEGLIGISRLSLLKADFIGARKICRQSINLNPDGAENLELEAQIEFFARNFSKAQNAYTLLERKDPDGGGTFYGAVSHKSALGRIALEQNQPGTGTALLRQCLESELKRLEAAPENPEILYRLAAVESSLGNSEKAIQHLQAAISAGWIDYHSLSLDPRFDTIADDERFHSVIGKVKLKTEELRRTINDP